MPDLKFTQLARGYDEITFQYDENEFASPASAEYDLYSKLEDELGFYYYVVSTRLKTHEDWDKIKGPLSKLTDVEGKRKFTQRLINILLRGRYINELFTAIVTLEVNQIFRRNLIDEGYRGIYSKNETTYLQLYIDEGLKELTSYPTTQISEAARFLEGRRSKTIELIIILIASLIGGVAGSLLTLLLTWNR